MKLLPIALLFMLCCPPSMLQHILNKNPIPLPRILHQHMGHRPDELPVLDDGAVAHERVKERATYFDRLFQFVTASPQFPFFFQYSVLDHFLQNLQGTRILHIQ